MKKKMLFGILAVSLITGGTCSAFAQENTATAQNFIVEKENADTYINPSGGRKLYSHERFKREQINLLFLDPDMDSIQYNQFGNEFINYLSIIDVMMFNDVSQIRGFLEKYNLNEE